MPWESMMWMCMSVRWLCWSPLVIIFAICFGLQSTNAFLRLARGVWE